MRAAISRSICNQFMSLCRSSLNGTTTTNDKDERKWLISLLLDSINVTQLYDPKERFELNTTDTVHANYNEEEKGNNDNNLLPRIVRPIVGLHLTAIPISIKGIPVIAYLSLTSSVTLLLPDFVQTFKFQTINHLRSNQIQNVLGQQSIPNKEAICTYHTMIDQFKFQLLDNNNNASDEENNPLTGSSGGSIGTANITISLHNAF